MNGKVKGLLIGLIAVIPIIFIIGNIGTVKGGKGEDVVVGKEEDKIKEKLDVIVTVEKDRKISKTIGKDLEESIGESLKEENIRVEVVEVEEGKKELDKLEWRKDAKKILMSLEEQSKENGDTESLEEVLKKVNTEGIEYIKLDAEEMETGERYEEGIIEVANFIKEELKGTDGLESVVKDVEVAGKTVKSVGVGNVTPEITIEPLQSDWVNKEVKVKFKFIDTEERQYKSSRYKVSESPDPNAGGMWGMMWNTGKEYEVETLTTENAAVRQTYIHFQVEDKEGNVTTHSTGVYKVEKVMPTLKIEEDKDSPKNEEIWVYVEAEDRHSGVEEIKWAEGNRNATYVRMNGKEVKGDTIHIENNGWYTVYVRDKAGNETTALRFVDSLDKVPPKIELSADTFEITNQDVEITAIVTDEGSGVAFKKWEKGRLSLEDFKDVEVGTYLLEDTFDVSSNGWYTVYALDKVGNSAVESIYIDNIDKDKVTIDLTLTPSGITNKDIQVSVDIKEKEKEIEEIKWELDYRNVEYFKDRGEIVKDKTFEVKENGEYTVYVRDKAGNESVKTFTVKNIDRVKPEIGYGLSTEMYTVEDVEVNLTIQDVGFGVSLVKYSKGKQGEGYFKAEGETLFEDREYDKDNVNGNIDGIGFTVKENGVYTVYAEDLAGNIELKEIEVGNIDREPPSIELEKDIKELTNKDVKVKVTITDNLSGVGSLKWGKGNLGIDNFSGGKGENIIGGSFTVKENGVYTVYASDKVGNEVVKVINIENIFKDIPSTPTFTATPTEQTDGKVTVTINYGEEGVVREYRVRDSRGIGRWEEYTGSIVLEENGVVEARMQNHVGTWSKIGRLDVENIKGEVEGDNTDLGGEYKLPLQQSKFESKGVDNGKREYEWEYVTDLFFMTKHTGFLTGYNYTEEMKKNFTSGSALPTFNTLRSIGKLVSEESYKDKVGETLVDDVMYLESEDGIEKMQRYMVPVGEDSPLRPGVEYKNHVEFENMGLSDVTLGYDQTFEFDKYLFGSSKDEAMIVEQVESRTKIEEMDEGKVNTVVIKYKDIKGIAKDKKKRSKERMHGFRYSDRGFMEKVKEKLNID